MIDILWLMKKVKCSSTNVKPTNKITRKEKRFPLFKKPFAIETSKMQFI